MNYNLFNRFLFSGFLLLFLSFTIPLQAEKNNCFKFKQGKFQFFNCNHNCSTDKKTIFNKQGRCSICGHLVKKRPDFFINVGPKNDTRKRS